MGRIVSRMRPLLALDRSSDVPLHEQIEHLLRRLARRPEYRNGKLLPSEVTLARRLKVSRNTLRAAMSRLEAEGLLQRKTKVGTRVSSSRPHISLQEWYSFTREMRRQGIEVENFELSVEQMRADKQVTDAFGIRQGARVWRLQRVRGWNGVPAVVAVSWLHPSLGVTGREDFTKPLYELIGEAADVVPAVSREQISAIKATGTLARALRIQAGEPVLLRQRVILDSRQRPIEYNLNYYRTDRYTLTLDLARPAPSLPSPGNTGGGKRGRGAPF